MNCYVSRQFGRVVASALLLASVGARAELRDISDDGMSDVWGQAMFEMTNTTLTPSPALGITAPIGDNGEVSGTLAFSKITIGADGAGCRDRQATFRYVYQGCTGFR